MMPLHSRCMLEMHITKKTAQRPWHIMEKIFALCYVLTYLGVNRGAGLNLRPLEYAQKALWVIVSCIKAYFNLEESFSYLLFFWNWRCCLPFRSKSVNISWPQGSSCNYIKVKIISDIWVQLRRTLYCNGVSWLSLVFIAHINKVRPTVFLTANLVK
jgi:hypothetical protein